MSAVHDAHSNGHASGKFCGCPDTMIIQLILFCLLLAMLTLYQHRLQQLNRLITDDAFSNLSQPVLVPHNVKSSSSSCD